MSGFEVQRRSPQATLTIHLHAPVEGIPAVMGEALPEAWHAAEALGLPPSGPPFTRYFSMPPGDVEFEAGVPVSDRAGAGLGRAEPGELPGGEVAVGWHVGPYDHARPDVRRADVAGSASRVDARAARCGRSTGPTPGRSRTRPPGGPR